MQEITWSTFKFYTENGARLSVFAKQIDNGRCKIYVIECSKKDEFNKSVAKQLLTKYLEGSVGAMRCSVEDIVNQREFLEYCERVYWKKSVVTLRNYPKLKTIKATFSPDNSKLSITQLYKL